jgi:hypothetical protein
VNDPTTTIGGDRCEAPPAGSDPATGRPPAAGSVLWQIHRSTGVVVALEPGHVAEPLPAGVWIRPAQETAPVAVHRRWLRSAQADRQSHPDRYRVVIGYPHCPAVQLGTVAEYCAIIPAEAWPAVRFSWFGPVCRPAGPGRAADAVGQALADLLARPVVVGTGVRICGPAESGGALDWVLLPDGAMAWLPFTTDYGFTPRGLAAQSSPDAPPAAPVPIDAARPFPEPVWTGTGATAPGDDDVFEVVQSELWVRSRRAAQDGAAVHGAQAGMPHADPVDGTTAGGVRELTADVLQRLVGGTRVGAGTGEVLGPAGTARRAPAPTDAQAPDASDGAASPVSPGTPAGPGQTRKGPIP